MSNILTEKNVRLNFVKRLQKNSKAWVKLCEAPLKNRQKMLNAWASGFYDLNYSRTHTVNFLDRGVSTLVPFLVEGNPKVTCETLISNIRHWAYTTELALNFYIEKLNLAENVLIPAVINSMFGSGIAKTTLIHDRNLAIEGELYKLGTPEVQIIDDTNYIGDPSAKRRQDFLMEGDIYRLPTEYAKEFFGKKYADDIVSDQKLREDYSPDDVSKSDFDKEILSIRDYSTFIDIYLHDEGILVTIMPEGKTPRILRTVEWEGPPGGPYDVLAYKYFPDMPISIPPAWDWYDKDITMNILMEKARQQAEAQQDILAYEGAAQEDVDRLIKTGNLGTCRVENLQLIKDFHWGGTNPLNYEYMNFIENHFTKSASPAGDVIAGRGAQAPTLGQEQMVMGNATRQIYNMLSRFDSFMTSIVRKLAWGFWTDPTQYIPVSINIPGVGELQEVFSDAGKVGDFYDFIFKVKPYSTQRTSPDMKFNKLMMLLNQWVMPTLPLAMAEGTTINHKIISEKLAAYLGEDDINQWYMTAVPGLLDNIGYKMLPKSQQGDQTQAPAKMANMFQQQTRAGGKPSPPQKGEERTIQ